MAYVPKMLLVGRCVRCGKRVFKGERRYKCPKCGVYTCPLCYRKVQGRCPVCGMRLEEI